MYNRVGDCTLQHEKGKVNRMKSSGTSYDTLFDAYENMCDRPEIESEIAHTIPMMIDRMKHQDILMHYFEGYLDALRWVIGEERKGTN